MTPKRETIRGFAMWAATSRALECHAEGKADARWVGLMASVRARRLLAQWLEGWSAEEYAARMRAK